MTYYYINKLISYKPDFRFNSNFAGAVQLISFTCIPSKKKIHITLLPFAYANCLSHSNILLHKLISHKPDFRFNSNFAGVVYLVPSSCIPNYKKNHVVLPPSTYVNWQSPVKYYYKNIRQRVVKVNEFF